MHLKPVSIETHAPELQPPPPAPPILEQAAGAYVETFGLGDAVAALAQPVARIVDKLVGSKLATCTPCRRRHSFLNKIVPDVCKPFKNFRRK